MDKAFLNNEDYALWRLLSNTFRRADYIISKQLTKIGVTGDIVGILHLIFLLDNYASPSQIAELALRKPQTLTSRLRVMTKRGFVFKTIDENRKNMYRYSLTPKGEKALEKSIKIRSYHRIMSTLTEEKRKVFTECLKEIRNNTTKLM